MIRRAIESDGEVLYRLICELEETALDKEAFLRIWTNQCRDAHYLCLVYEADHTVVALCNLRMEDQLHHGAKIAEIMELYVSAKLRSQGIGKQLLDAACAFARRNGCLQIEVSSNQRRVHAHRFYEKVGFAKHHFKFTQLL